MAEIRLLTPDDAKDYWDLRLEALEREAEAFTSSAEEHRTLSLDDVRARLGVDPGNSFVIGAFEGKELVGTAGFYREKGLKTSHKGHVWGVYVTFSARGKGIGRQILRMLLERAASIDGLEQIQLSVGTTQAAAANLYRSLGFESWGCEPSAVKIGSRYVDEGHMVLRFDRVRKRGKAAADRQSSRKKRP